MSEVCTGKRLEEGRHMPPPVLCQCRDEDTEYSVSNESRE